MFHYNIQLWQKYLISSVLKRKNPKMFPFGANYPMDENWMFAFQPHWPYPLISGMQNGNVRRTTTGKMKLLSLIHI